MTPTAHIPVLLPECLDLLQPRQGGVYCDATVGLGGHAEAVLEASDQVEYTIRTNGREPVVWMTGFGESSLNFVLGVWVANEHVKRPVALASEYLWAIDDALHKYNIEIPFPQRDLHLRSDDRGTGASSVQ